MGIKRGEIREYYVRKFGGKRYTFDSLHFNKRYAKEKADKLRGRGESARIIPITRKGFGTKYLVYTRL